jgi:hypothetical protein
VTWSEIGPADLVDDLGVKLREAATQAYAANIERHMPEELGLKAVNFGLDVSTSARHLAAQKTEKLDGVTDVESGNARWLAVRHEDTTHRIFIYKAPPGAASVEDVPFDTKMKKHLGTENAAQFVLPLDGHVDLTVINVFAVLFGDVVTGLDRIVAGAPYLHQSGTARDPKTEVRWAWTELLGGPHYGTPMRPASPAKSSTVSPVDEDLPVRLRPVPVERTDEATG